MAENRNHKLIKKQINKEEEMLLERNIEKGNTIKFKKKMRKTTFIDRYDKERSLIDMIPQNEN